MRPWFLVLGLALFGACGGSETPHAGAECRDAWQTCPAAAACVTWEGEARCWPRCHYTPTAAPCEGDGACAALPGGAVDDGVCLPTPAECLPLDSYPACHPL